MFDRDPVELELGHDARRKLDSGVPKLGIADRRPVGFPQLAKEQGLLALAGRSIGPRSASLVPFTREEPDVHLPNHCSGGLRT
jgi:hypothetical protein